jgi:uncharacterized membrane protein YeiB
MSEIISDTVGFFSSFAESSPVIFYGVLAVIAFLLYRRPKFFLITLTIVLLVAGVVYIIMEMASPANSKKRQMIDQKAPAENVCKLPRLNL